LGDLQQWNKSLYYRALPEVLCLEFKPACSGGHLLLQHLDALEREAEEKDGVQ
jgi:hypothetical protein